MIDSHFHLWTSDNSTPEKRAERADMVRQEANAMNVDRIALIGEVDDTIEGCRKANETVAKYVDEHPDLFYGWARVDPRLDDAAIEEFKRAVREDGLVGLKHHFFDGTPVNISDPVFYPMAETAIELDVPIIAHVMHRTEADAKDWDDSEAHTEDVLHLAQRYPELKLISAHIVGGGDPEYRIKNIEDQENVYLDVSGSVNDRNMIEMAADRLGIDRLVFGTDTWFVHGVGKLEGCDLTAEEKAAIAYNFESLLPETVPNKLSNTEIEEKQAATVERLSRVKSRRGDRPIIDVNAYVGRWPFRKLEFSGADLVDYMDREGIDRALVSSMGSVMYRNVQHGNHELMEDIAGYEDRLLPVATINPAYPSWYDDLEECIDTYGMHAVKLLPAYHDYDPNHEEAKALLNVCAERDLPVILTATLEDHRGRQPRLTLRGFEDGGSKYWTGDHVDALIDLLTACPETDVIVANAWNSVFRMVRSCCEIQRNGVRLDNRVRTGETYFTIDDLHLYFTYQGEQVADVVGSERLVFGPQSPFKIVESSYKYVEHLPVSADERERIFSGNVADLLDIDINR